MPRYKAAFEKSRHGLWEQQKLMMMREFVAAVWSAGVLQCACHAQVYQARRCALQCRIHFLKHSDTVQARASAVCHYRDEYVPVPGAGSDWAALSPADANLRARLPTSSVSLFRGTSYMLASRSAQIVGRRSLRSRAVCLRWITRNRNAYAAYRHNGAPRRPTSFERWPLVMPQAQLS